MSKCTLLFFSFLVCGALAQNFNQSRGGYQGGQFPNQGNGQLPISQGGQGQLPINQGGYQGNGDLSFPVGGGASTGRGQGGINDQCSRNQDCSAIPGSFCKHGSCQCDDDKIAINGLKKCALVAKRSGDACEDDLQCKGNDNFGLGLGSKCQDRKCQCLQSYNYYDHNDGQTNPQCYKTTKLGESCQHIGQCTKMPDPKRVACNSVCECLHPFVESSDKTQCNGAASLGVGLSLLFAALLARFTH